MDIQQGAYHVWSVGSKVGQRGGGASLERTERKWEADCGVP